MTVRYIKTMDERAGHMVTSRSAGDTEALGHAVGRLAQPGLYIALCGELGGGKTTFVRGLAAGLGARERVASPTFVLMRQYQGRLTLFHCDFYRLGAGGDIAELELEQCLEQGVVAAEWADLCDTPHGAQMLELHFQWTGDDSRTIHINAPAGDPDGLISRLLNKFQ